MPAPSALAQAIARRRLRNRIEEAVSRLIDALDALDPDPDLEPCLGAPDASPQIPQWPRSSPDDRDEEDEHGGDVLDEPHDAEPDEDDGAAEPDDRDLPKSQAEAEAWLPAG